MQPVAPTFEPLTNVALQDAPRAQPRGWLRWEVCGLLFLATTINYMDRQVIGVLKPSMQTQLKWDENDYANIVFAFQLTYAAGQLVSGPLIDRIGTRLGYALAVIGWSLASMSMDWREASLASKWLAAHLASLRVATFRPPSKR